MVNIMGEKTVFRFVYGGFGLKKWKEIVQKVLDVASKAGFKFQTFKITSYYPHSHDIEGEWKDETQLFKILEKEAKRCLKAKKDMFLDIYGDFSGYFTELDFLLDPHIAKDFAFFVESADPKLVKASVEDKLKLNKLLKDFSNALGTRISEWGNEAPYGTKVKICRYGFMIDKKGRRAKKKR